MRNLFYRKENFKHGDRQWNTTNIIINFNISRNIYLTQFSEIYLLCENMLYILMLLLIFHMKTSILVTPLNLRFSIITSKNILRIYDEKQSSCIFPPVCLKENAWKDLSFEANYCPRQERERGSSFKVKFLSEIWEMESSWLTSVCSNWGWNWSSWMDSSVGYKYKRTTGSGVCGEMNIIKS